MNNQTVASQNIYFGGRLRVFSLYIDFPGSICSRWANSTITQYAGAGWITSTEVWNLGSITANASIRIMTNAEAARADIVTVTISSFSYSQHELLGWLEAVAQCYTEGRREAGLMLGFFSHDDCHARELNWTVKSFQNISRRMNRDFVWQGLDTGVMPDAFWLKNHLKTFLTRKSAALKQSLLAKAPPSFTEPPVLAV